MRRLKKYMTGLLLLSALLVSLSGCGEGGGTEAGNPPAPSAEKAPEAGPARPVFPMGEAPAIVSPLPTP